MKTYFDNKFREWCAEEKTGEYTAAAWGKTEEEAIERLNDALTEFRRKEKENENNQV